MDKKKISKEQKEFSLQEEFIGIREVQPTEKLLDKKFTLEAIVECLLNSDIAGAKEVFQNYLWAVNKSKLSRNSRVPRSTIAHCLEHQNPTIDTFFKILSA